MIQHFLDYIAIERKYSQRTVEAYHDDLRDFCRFMGWEIEDFNPENLGEYEVKAWMLDMIEEQHQSPRSVKRKLSALRSFYKFLLRQKKVKRDITARIVPYKQYSSAVIEALLSLKGDDIKEATFPGESSSMYRIISWFSLLRLYFEGVLNSLKLQWKDDLEIQKDLASLLPLVATSLPAGWLKMLVRYAVNSGFWLQTHFA